MTASDPNERRPWRTDKEWTRLHARLSTSSVDLPKRRRRVPAWLWASAASLILGVPTLLLLRQPRNAARPRADDVRTIVTRAGERSVIRLADSSTITLAPSTTVRIALSQARRDIQLDGMADFHVVHDATRPFIVRSGDAVTTDIGTRFVVRGYAADSSVRVAVTEGSVSVAVGDAPGAITLTSGDVAMVSNRSARKLASSTAPLYETWIDGGLSFDDAPLRQVAADLERWFDVEIRVDPGIATRRVSAVYSDATLDAVLTALSTALDLSSTRNGRVVTLRNRAAR